MKKLCFAVAMAAGMIGLTGCVSLANRAPQGDVALEALKTTATYDVIGDAVGTSSGGVLFGIFNVGGEDKTGQLGYSILLNPTARAAMYNAIESVPTADALLAPRFSITSENYFIYRKETVTVKGKAIRYNVSAK